jgi:hypothetical protein
MTYIEDDAQNAETGDNSGVELTRDAAYRIAFLLADDLMVSVREVRPGSREKARYDLEIAYKERGKWWQFTARIPRYRPEDITVRGCAHNPRYTNDIPLQHKKKREIEARVRRALEEVLHGRNEGN